METARIALAPSLRLVRRSVQRNHRLVDQPLVGRVHAFQLRRNHALHVVHGLQHALAQVMASCRRRAAPRPHARRSRRPKAQWRGPWRRFPESRPLPRSDFRASQELRGHVWQQSQSYRSSRCGAAAGRSVWDGDPRQEPLRRRFESCSKAPARLESPLRPATNEKCE